MREDILGKKEQILQWIEEKQSKAFICRELNCKPETLNSYLNKMGIEYKGQQNKKGQYKGHDYIPAMYYIETGKIIHSSRLKEKLVRDGLKENKCELCGVSIWQGKQLPLELHHKDGNHYNNNLNNLSIFFISARSAIDNGTREGRVKINKQDWFYTATYLIGNGEYDFAAVIPETVDVATCKELATRINDSTFDILRGSPQISEDFYFYTTSSGEDWMQRSESERKQTCESGANSSGQVHFYMGF